MLTNFESKYTPEMRQRTQQMGLNINDVLVIASLVEREAQLPEERPTIADVSLTGYLYYPADEFGFDIAKEHPAIGAWLGRMKILPGWGHPYDLMPGHPFGSKPKQ